MTDLIAEVYILIVFISWNIYFYMNKCGRHRFKASVDSVNFQRLLSFKNQKILQFSITAKPLPSTKLWWKSQWSFTSTFVIIYCYSTIKYLGPHPEISIKSLTDMVSLWPPDVLSFFSFFLLQWPLLFGAGCPYACSDTLSLLVTPSFITPYCDYFILTTSLNPSYLKMSSLCVNHSMHVFSTIISFEWSHWSQEIL